VSDFDEALLVVRQLKDLGYQKLVTTPHIMSDTYRNDPVIIGNRLKELILFLSATALILRLKPQPSIISIHG